MTERTARGGSLPPPWLWLLLCTYLWELPSGVVWWHEQIRDLWTDGGAYGPEVVASPGFAALRVSTVSQIMPSLVLVAGLVTVAVPHLRGRYTRRRYRLVPLTALGPAGATPQGVSGLRDFAATVAPGATVMVSLWGSSPPARVYAAGWRGRRIAVSLGFVALWRRDPERARALLLHEAGHLGSGEHLIAGLGSPFTRAVQAWPVVFLACGAAPLVWLAWRHEPTASLMWPQVLVVLSRATVIMVPVAALWCAELAADRYAAVTAGRPAVRHALDEIGAVGGRRWGGPTHPPSRLRRWCVQRADGPVVPVLLAVAGPVALLAHAAVVACFTAVALVLAGDPGSSAVATSLDLAHRDVLTVPLWSALVGLAVVWPWLAPRWGRLWGAGGPGSGEAGGRAGRVSDGLGRRARAAVIALPAVALAVALLPSTGAVERDPVLRPAAAEADR
ncbi:hypothetical protein ACFQ9U_16520 [Streptomyces sp. NPDC056568]|uniref:hypothetical protein n=1 Tax=Streptomyces sp. NPDC056568 TaxID=3345866 RepID=UPI003673F6E7